jgi:hypothetical protein
MRRKGGVIGGQFLLSILVDETIPLEVDLYLCGDYLRFLAEASEVLGRRLLFRISSGSDFIVQFQAQGKTDTRMMLHVTERPVHEHINTCFGAKYLKSSFDGRKLVVEICDSWREDF